MAKNIDILDAVNQKYNNVASGLTATNVKAAIDELAVEASLADSVFPTYAVFDARNDAAAALVNFASGNAHQIDAAVYSNITLTSPAGQPGHFTLRILNSGSLATIAPSAGGNIRWGDNTLPTWSGTSTLYLYYDGTDWEGSANVNIGSAA